MFSTYLQQSLQPLCIRFSPPKQLSNLSHDSFSQICYLFFFLNIFNTTAAGILYTYSIHLTIAHNSQPRYLFHFKTIKTDAAAKSHSQFRMFEVHSSLKSVLVNRYIAHITQCYSMSHSYKEKRERWCRHFPLIQEPLHDSTFQGFSKAYIRRQYAVQCNLSYTICNMDNSALKLVATFKS